MTEVSPTPLQPMFKDSPLTLGRLLPAGKAAYLGLRSRFCDLRAFTLELKERSWSGHLYATVEGWRAHVLFCEGEAVAAACREDEGEVALSSLQDMFQAGAVLSGFRLEPEVARALSGVRGAPLPEAPPPGFWGTVLLPSHTELWQEGRAVARLAVSLGEQGLYPAPSQPTLLSLNGPLSAQFGQRYALSLRGRDALSPITHMHAALRREHGPLALTLLEGVRDHGRVLEVVQNHTLDTEQAGQMLERLLGQGYLRPEES